MLFMNEEERYQQEDEIDLMDYVHPVRSLYPVRSLRMSNILILGKNKNYIFVLSEVCKK